MPHIARQYWQDLQGRVPMNFNWDVINNDSVVLVSAAEYVVDAASPTTSPRIVRDANVTVSNVSPHGPPHDPNQGVTFVVMIDSPQPINIVTDITVLDDPPESIGGV